MKKIAIAVFIVTMFLTITPAIHADCAQFGGFYGGINVGWANLNSNWTDRDAWVDNFSNDWALGTVSNSEGGVTAGAYLGYNLQRGCTLFGIEVDGHWADISNTKTYTPTSSPGTMLTIEDKLDFYATARGRMGLIIDNLLLYFTGGVAFANIQHDYTINDPNIPALESLSASKAQFGVVAGAGAEYALTSHLSIKPEFLYFYFPEKETSFYSTAGSQTVHFDNQDSMWIVRMGLTYRF